MENFEQLANMLVDFFDAKNEPLDGDEVDVVCERLKIELNFNQGNISESEYNALISNLDLPCVPRI